MTGTMALFGGFAAVLAGLTLVWAASVVRRDASLVDRYWGPAFALLAWWYLISAGGWVGAPFAARLLAVLVTVWGLRLGFHITRRNWGHGEDPRYRAMRDARGPGFWWISWFTVFLLQALLAWVIAMPLFAAARAREGGSAAWVALGSLCWAAGFLFEAVGDAQLARFKADPANRGSVMDTGLWRYTRHPNYFGDALLWWGYFGFAAAVGAWWTAVGPALMTFLLMRVSGVALLEKTLRDTKPAYRDYVRRTSPFIPRPPLRGSGGMR
jgi:steroid 5-alpha reductase family enzyme